MQALKSPLEPERKRAIQTLVKSRDVRAVEVLQKVASTDESVAIRYLAKKAIYYLRKQLGLGELSAGTESGSTQSLFPAGKLKSILEADDGEAKLRLLQALSRRKVASALPTLLEYDATSDTPEVRSTLVLVIGILGGEEELKYLKDYLRDEDPRVRANAIEAIEYLGTPMGYPLVVKALGDPDNRIRANAIKALRSYGKVNCLALLQRMMESNKVWMRDSAAHALAFLGGAEGLPLLLGGLRDPEPSVREKARKGLERLADKGVRAASEALAEFEEAPPGKETIETFLEGRDLPDSFFAADGEEEADEDPLLSDDPKERIRGVDEIIETGDIARRGALLDAARAEGDTYVRAKMLIGLGRIGDRTTVELLL
ncbi:MAG: HEAT repeat domain-containing protein, partial [Planctomycetota bacterium]